MMIQYNSIARYLAYLLTFSVLFFITDRVTAQPPIHIGMSLAEAKHKFPQASVTVEEKITTTLTLPETVNGLAGKWHLTFKKNKLDHALFDVYDDSLSAERFNRFLMATKKTIRDYSNKMAKPDSVINGKMVFQDPYKKKHWGYLVKEVRWNNYNGMKVKIGFNFFGGKGVYRFIFSIGCFDKDYPYFN